MPSALRIYHVQGRRSLLHPECVEGFRMDRTLGLIYGPYRIVDPVTGTTRWAMHAEEASIVAKFCPYCGKE